MTMITHNIPKNALKWKKEMKIYSHKAKESQKDSNDDNLETKSSSTSLQPDEFDCEAHLRVLLVYWSNLSNLKSASDLSLIEHCPPLPTHVLIRKVWQSITRNR
jgi:hypothetical protein